MADQGLAAVHRAKAQLRPLREPDGWPPITDFAPASAASSSAGTSTDGGCLAAPTIATVVDATQLTAAQFQERFETANCPAILGGLLSHWPAASRRSHRAWTLDKLLQRLRDHLVQCGDDAYGENVELPFSAFVLDYMQGCPDRNPMLVFDSVILQPGAVAETAVTPEPEPHWEPKSDTVLETEESANHGGCDLCDDYTVPAIFAHDDYLSELGELVRPPYRWILVAPARSGSFVHTDPMATHAWNALLVGMKRWVMFHPSTPADLLAPWAGKYKRLAPDCKQAAGEHGECEDDWEDLWGWFADDLPEIKRSVAAHFRTRPLQSAASTGADDERVADQNGEEWWYRDFVQREGEIVYVPSMWHHAVLNLCDTVAVTQNYCSRTNLHRCYAMATGQDPLVGAMNSGASTNDLDCDVDASRTAAGLCPELQRQWLSAMLEKHPDVAAPHMPREWLQDEEIVGVDG